MAQTCPIEGLAGIDAGYPQGGAVDWAAVRAGGVAFAWFREGEANWREGDATFTHNWSGGHEAGIACGPYHPVHGDSPGRDQARIFRDRCPLFRPFVDLRPAIDLETRGGSPLHEAEAMAEEVEKLFGVAPILYVGKWFAREIGLTRSSPLAKLLLWIPAYDVRFPALPDAWDDFAVWQWVGNGGRVVGVQNDCDRNVIRTKATLDACIGVAGIAKTDPAPPPSARPMTTLEGQRALLAVGYALPKYGADGAYGAETRAAILAFQGRAGLPGSGKLDEATSAALRLASTVCR